MTGKASLLGDYRVGLSRHSGCGRQDGGRGDRQSAHYGRASPIQSATCGNALIVIPNVKR